MKKHILFFILIGLMSTPAIAGMKSGYEIMLSSYNRDDGSDSYIDSKMILIDKSNNPRERRVAMHTKDFGKLLKGYIEFLEPGDIKGTAFLSWENEGKDDTQYLYLPALGRARRIVSSQKDLRFVNTDFTYEDMQRRLPEKDTHFHLVDEIYNGYDCYVIESVAKKKTSQYKRRMHWVDKKSLIIVKTLFYNKKDQLIKEFQVNAMKLIDGYWTATLTTMIDHKDKHKTILEAIEVKYDQGLDNSMFTLRQFKE